MNAPPKVDQEKLRLQLARLEQSLLSLKNISPKDTAPITNAARERYIQICVEETINIANNIITSNAFRRAETYRDLFLVLEENKVISSSLSKELQQFASFRNRLVHLYWIVSPKEFTDQLKKMKYLHDFAGIVAKKYLLCT